MRPGDTAVCTGRHMEDTWVRHHFSAWYRETKVDPMDPGTTLGDRALDEDIRVWLGQGNGVLLVRDGEVLPL